MDKVVHFEIPADDLPRAQKFYSAVFGWHIMKVPEMDYHMVTTTEVDQKTFVPKAPGAINGGMMKRMIKGESPVIIVGVSSIEQSLKQIERAGGKRLMPIQTVGDMGLYARVQDTEGNVIGVWQNLPKPTEGTSAKGAKKKTAKPSRSKR